MRSLPLFDDPPTVPAPCFYERPCRPRPRAEVRAPEVIGTATNTVLTCTTCGGTWIESVRTLCAHSAHSVGTLCRYKTKIKIKRSTRRRVAAPKNKGLWKSGKPT